MSYAVKFRSRDLPDIIVNNVRGDKLKELWFDDDKKNTPVDIDGNAYLVGDIKAITRTSVDAEPMGLPPEHVSILPSGKRCAAQYSIQKEINRLAQEEPDWGTKIRDKKWRQQQYQMLRSQAGVLWCDDKAQECACD